MAVEGRRVAIVSASVGAGHDGAAVGLAGRLRARGFTVELHDFLGLLPRPLGRMVERAYVAENRVAPMTWGWTHDTAGCRLVAGTISPLSFRLAARRTLEALGESADAVVSTYHLSSQTLARLRRSGRLEVPVITFLTDMSVHRLWVASGIDAHLALHPVAAAEARRLGARCVRTCNPALPEAFRPVRSEQERLRCRERFGLPVEATVALCVTGSDGLGRVERTVADLAGTGLVLPVVCCGNNAELRSQLRGTGTAVPLGWIDDMPALLRASDLVVQNAGGRTSLESLASGVPTLTYRPVPGHGRTNAAALDRAGLARWVRSADELPAILRAVLDAGTQVGIARSLPSRDPAQVIADVVTAHRARLAGTKIPA